jgi:hypothetical protein
LYYTLYSYTLSFGLTISDIRVYYFSYLSTVAGFIDALMKISGYHL